MSEVVYEETATMIAAGELQPFVPFGREHCRNHPNAFNLQLRELQPASELWSSDGAAGLVGSLQEVSLQERDRVRLVKIHDFKILSGINILLINIIWTGMLAAEKRLQQSEGRGCGVWRRTLHRRKCGCLESGQPDTSLQCLQGLYRRQPSASGQWLKASCKIHINYNILNLCFYVQTLWCHFSVPRGKAEGIV